MKKYFVEIAYKHWGIIRDKSIETIREIDSRVARVYYRFKLKEKEKV